MTSFPTAHRRALSAAIGPTARPQKPARLRRPTRTYGLYQHRERSVNSKKKLCCSKVILSGYGNNHSPAMRLWRAGDCSAGRRNSCKTRWKKLYTQPGKRARRENKEGNQGDSTYCNDHRGARKRFRSARGVSSALRGGDERARLRASRPRIDIIAGYRILSTQNEGS